ncbi:hypothetical protein ACLK1T_06785 [Escherichia coli]
MSATLDNDCLQQMRPERPSSSEKGARFRLNADDLPLPAHQRFDEAVAVATAEMLRQESGLLLLFLPGVGEIQRVQEQLASRIGSDVLLGAVWRVVGERSAKSDLPGTARDAQSGAGDQYR